MTNPKPGQPSAKTDTADADHESDVKVITRSVYRINGGGYLDYKHPEHIWVISTPQGSEDEVKPKQLTSGKYAENGVMWSKDSSTIYFTADRVDDPSYERPRTDVYSMAATGGAPAKLMTIEMAAREMSLSPDGKQLAFCAALNDPVQSYTEPNLWVVELADGAKPRKLTAGYEVCGGVGGDQGTPRAGGQDHIVWTADGNNVITSVAREGRTNLIQVDVKSNAGLTLTASRLRSRMATRRWNASAQTMTLQDWWQ